MVEESTPTLLTVSLKKDIRMFVIRYELGSESIAIDQLIIWVNDYGFRFDWFDAAIMSHQIGQNMITK